MTQHLYLAVKGSYTVAELAAEVWQFGIRLRVSNTNADQYGTLPSDGNWLDDESTISEPTLNGESNYVLGFPLGTRFDPLEYLRDQAAPAVDTFIKKTDVSHTGVKVDELVLYGYENERVAQTGTGPAKAAVQWKTANRPSGVGSGNMMPLEVSIVTSWRTAVQGRRGRGRIYLPPTTTAILGTQTGSLAAGKALSIANAAAAFIDDLKFTQIGPSGARVDPIVTGKPYQRYAQIIGVRVGSIPDAQRRRRQQLDETYADVTV